MPDSAASPYRLVIFDIDDVLYDYSRDKRVAALMRSTGLTETALRAALWDGDFEDRAEAGDPGDGESYLARFVERLGVPLSREAWTAARVAAMTPWKDAIALAAAVSRKATIATLTNNPWLHLEEMPRITPEIYPVFEPHVYASCEFGARKPDAAVYLRLCAKVGVAPEAAVFIDDKEANVAGARAAGLVGLRFTDVATLKDELAQLGLVPAGF